MIMSTKEICKRGLSMTISLTLGNTRLPLAHRFVGDVEPLRQLLLGEILFLAELGHKAAELDVVQGNRSFHSLLS